MSVHQFVRIAVRLAVIAFFAFGGGLLGQAIENSGWYFIGLFVKFIGLSLALLYVIGILYAHKYFDAE